MNNKKGISPLIATVLIVGFTIVLAVLVITWISGTVNTQTKNADCMADANSKCLNVINSLTVKSSWYGSPLPSYYTYTVTNTQDLPVTFSWMYVTPAGVTTLTNGHFGNATVNGFGTYAPNPVNSIQATTGTYGKLRIIPRMSSTLGDGCIATCDVIEVNAQ